MSRRSFPGTEGVEREWAIRWTEPEEIRDTITIVDSLTAARSFLNWTFGSKGVPVYRTVTYSQWKED